jgi:hypothetical protein
MNHIVVIFPVKELLFYFVFIYFIFKMSNAYHCLVHTVLFMEFDGYSFIVKPKLLMYYFRYGQLILSLSRVRMVAPICCSFYVTGIFCMVFTVLYY